MTPDIVVQLKGGTTTVTNFPTGQATRLTELSDVDPSGLVDGAVVAWTAVNAKFKLVTVNNVVISVAGKAGAVVLNSNDIIENLSSNLWFTAARVRANVFNTAPINYNSTTGMFSHAVSGAVANSYGNAAATVALSVDQFGHVTGIANANIAIDTTQLITGVLTTNRGGTGANVYTNGQILIGNSISGGLDVGQIVQGGGIIVTNSNGIIKIDATAGKTYYLGLSDNSGVTDIVTGGYYRRMFLVPDQHTQNNSVLPAVNSASYAYIGGFLTDPNEPSITSLPAGQYERSIYAVTDGINNYANIRADLYAYSANGQETLLRSSNSPSFNNATPGGTVEWIVTDGTSYTLNITDRLLLKLWAIRVSGQPTVSVTTSFEGTVKASFITTSILVAAGSDVTARLMAGEAYAQANIASNTANASFIQANAAFNQANVSNTWGYHTIWIPAITMYPQVSNGATVNAATEMFTNHQILRTIDFDPNTTQYSQFAVKMPNSWDLGIITANIVWSYATSAGTTNTVVFGVQAIGYSTGDALDIAWSTPQLVVAGGPNPNSVYYSGNTAPFTPAGALRKGDYVIVRVYRDASNVADTLPSNVRVHGINFRYLTNASTDV